MGANDLNASLTLNSTKYEAAISRAEAKAAAFADKVQNKFSKKIGNLLGVDALSRILSGPFQKAIDTFTEKPFARAEEIKKGAEGLRVTAEEYQMVELAAKAAGMTTDEWINSIQQSKTPIGQAISHLEQFRGQIELTNEQVSNLARNSFWTDIQKWWTPKLAEGFKFITDAATLWGLKAGGMSLDDAAKAIKEDDAADKLNMASETGGLAAALTGNKTAAIGKAGGADIGVNALQKIGASVGGSDPAQQARNQIVKNTEATAKAAAETNASLKRLAEGGGIFRGAGAGGEW
jgi:hypothetical protein